MHSTHPSSGTPGLRSAATRYRIAGIAVFSVVFGLLIWAKLQLVASVPRTVLAVPSAAPTDQPPGGSAPSPAEKHQP